jgi:hypothetical protein
MVLMIKNIKRPPEVPRLMTGIRTCTAILFYQAEAAY